MDLVICHGILPNGANLVESSGMLYLLKEIYRDSNWICTLNYEIIGAGK